MYVCVFPPFLLSPAPPLQHNPEWALAAVHKMKLCLWPDATCIHLVGFDCIYKETTACHSAKSTDIATIMVSIWYSWSPLNQGYRYRCHHGKYLLLPIAAHGLSIVAIHSKYWGSILAAITQYCDGSFIITHCLAVHHSTSTPLEGSVTVQGLS